MSLEHNVPREMTRGSYALLADITSGSVSITMSAQGSAFIPVPDAIWSDSTVVTVDLPACTIQANITGVAQVELLKIDYKL